MKELRDRSAGQQEEANKDLIAGIKEQVETLFSDSNDLERLQEQAQTADGRMQAIAAGNQLAGKTIGQFIGMRLALLAQHNAYVAHRQAELNEQSLKQVATENFVSGEFTPSPNEFWSITDVRP